MFTENQIKFMRSLGIEVDFDNLSDNDLVQIEERVGNELQRSGFGIDNTITDTGKLCESILDKL